MPKVSVIIPVYNVEKYLRECLDSVVNQTLKDIEIICVNDYSTDNSPKILEEYASHDNRIKIINNEKNIHAGQSRNKGLSLSSGEYVFFMDSDDYLELNALETVVRILDMNTDAAFCIFCKVLHDQSTNETTKIKTFSKKLINSGKISKICINTKINDILRCEVPAWTKVYRRNFLTENNIMFDDLKCANDRYFYFQTVFKAQKLILLEEYLINHRINVKNSLIQKRSKHFECMYKSYEYVTSLYNNKNTEIQNIIIDLTLRDIFHFYNKASKNDQKKIKPKLKLFLKNIKFPNALDSYRNKIWYKWYCEMTKKYTLKNFIQTIFSVKNSYNRKHKIITLLGIKIKYRRSQV